MTSTTKRIAGGRGARVTIAMAVVAVSASVATGFALRESIERPRDPWVFRCVLDKNPRVAVIALHEDLWLAYDARNCGMIRLWRDGVRFTGTVFDTRHGPQPQSRGEPFLQGPAGDVWRVRRGGETIETLAIWRGYRFEDDRVVMQYDLTLPGGDVISIDESPEVVDPGSLQPGLERRFVMRRAPAGVEVQLVLYDGEPRHYQHFIVESSAGLSHQHRPEQDNALEALTVIATLKRNDTTTITKRMRHGD